MPKPAAVKHVLRRGVWIHACLEAVHKQEDWLHTLTALVEQVSGPGWSVPDEEIDALRSETADIISGYIDYWADKPDGQFEPVLVEKELTYQLGTHELTATLDYLGRFSDGLWIVEVKSTGDIPPPLWRGVDPQTGVQLLAARAAGYDVEGIRFDYLSTKLPPTPRVKNDGHLYAKSAVTTAEAFDRCAPDVVKSWSDKNEGAPDAYLDHMRRELVNNGAFYQRWDVIRPDEQLEATTLDVRHLIAHVTLATSVNYFPRSYHALTCRRFCDYGDLCMSEYLMGRVLPSMRQAEFDIDDGSREGDTARQKVREELDSEW